MKDGRIVAVGQFEAMRRTEIDAAGLIVAPGFIDIHSHSDYTLLVDPRAVSALAQGVTLEVIGNCGFGCAPIRDPALAAGQHLRLQRQRAAALARRRRVSRAACAQRGRRSTC